MGEIKASPPVALKQLLHHYCHRHINHHHHHNHCHHGNHDDHHYNDQRLPAFYLFHHLCRSDQDHDPDNYQHHRRLTIIVMIKNINIILIIDESSVGMKSKLLRTHVSLEHLAAGGIIQ